MLIRIFHQPARRSSISIKPQSSARSVLAGRRITAILAVPGHGQDGHDTPPPTRDTLPHNVYRHADMKT